MQPNNPYQPVPPPQPHEYDFLMDSQKPQRSGPSLPSNMTAPARIAVVVGGLVVLLIFFFIIKGLVSGKGNIPALTSVAQQQQQLISIAQNADQDSQQAALSTATKNFAVTADATMTSAQHRLLVYMKNNGHTVSNKTLALRLSATIDQQLTTAAANANYDSTFKQVMQIQLNDYLQTLNTAYGQTTGVKGRALLKDEYKGAQLLLTQLNTPASD